LVRSPQAVLVNQESMRVQGLQEPSGSGWDQEWPEARRHACAKHLAPLSALMLLLPSHTSASTVHTHRPATPRTGARATANTIPYTRAHKHTRTRLLPPENYTLSDMCWRHESKSRMICNSAACGAKAAAIDRTNRTNRSAVIQALRWRNNVTFGGHSARRADRRRCGIVLVRMRPTGRTETQTALAASTNPCQQKQQPMPAEATT
jgi:hypothetical protein